MNSPASNDKIFNEGKQANQEKSNLPNPETEEVKLADDILIDEVDNKPRSRKKRYIVAVPKNVSKRKIIIALKSYHVYSSC